MPWRTPAPPAAALARPVPRARLVLDDGPRVLLERPTVQGDSIVGEEYRGGTGARTAVARGRVAHVEVASYDGLRTVGLVAGVAAGLFAAYLVAFALATGPNY